MTGRMPADYRHSPSSAEPLRGRFLDLIRNRVVAGLRRAKAQGRRLGRPRRHHVGVEQARALVAEGLSRRAIARRLNAHPMAVRKALASA